MIKSVIAIIKTMIIVNCIIAHTRLDIGTSVVIHMDPSPFAVVDTREQPQIATVKLIEYKYDPTKLLHTSVTPYSSCHCSHLQPCLC